MQTFKDNINPSTMIRRLVFNIVQNVSMNIIVMKMKLTCNSEIIG